VIAHVQDDLAAELQSALDEPLEVLVGANPLGALGTIASESSVHRMEPAQPRLDGRAPECHSGSPYR
jgi:hypothetical protein